MAKDNFPTQDIDVFISYKREERGLAMQVASGLEAAGYTQVTDINLQTGKHFGREIEAMIRRARVVLVLWTPQSVTSEWVLDEAALAKELGTYLGVMVQPTNLPLGLNRIQHLDLQGAALDVSLPQILDAVTDRIGMPRMTGTIATTQSQAVSDDMLFFQTADRVDSVEGYQGYLTAFPNGYMAPEARARIDRLSTFGYKAWKHRASLIALMGIAATIAVALIAPMLAPAPYAGDLTASEESALRAQRNTLQTELDRLKTFAETGPTEDLRTAQAQITSLTDQLNRAREELAATEQDHTQDTAKAKAAHAAEITRLNTAVAGLQDQIESLEAAANLPSPDCTADDGKDGHLFPTREGRDRQCVSIATTKLSLWNTDITDVDMPKLAALTALQDLDLANTQVSDIAPLKSLTALQDLDLANTQVSDIAPLKSLTNLHHLWLPDGIRIGYYTDTPEARAAVQRAIATWSP